MTVIVIVITFRKKMTRITQSPRPPLETLRQEGPPGSRYGCICGVQMCTHRHTHTHIYIIYYCICILLDLYLFIYLSIYLFILIFIFYIVQSANKYRCIELYINCIILI